MTALYAMVVSIILSKVLYCIEYKPPFYLSWHIKNPSGGIYTLKLAFLSCPELISHLCSLSWFHQP